MKKNRMSKAVSLILTLLLCFSVFTVPVFADSADPEIKVSNGVTATVVKGTDDTYEVKVDITGKSGTSVKNAKMDVVLAVDVSGSMMGDGLVAAKAGAKKFVDKLLGAKSDVRIALIAFNTCGNLIKSFTDNKADLHAAIDGLSAAGTTNMSDAISTATTEFNTKGRTDSQKAFVLLSDGIPNSTADAYTAIDSMMAAYSDMSIYTIGCDIVTSGRTVLENIAKKANAAGAYFDASTDDLDQVFTNVATEIITLVDKVTVTSSVAAPFEIVPGSAKTSSPEVSLDDKDLARGTGTVKATIGSLKEDQKVSFTYQVRILQDADLSVKAPDFVFDYVYEFTKDGNVVQKNVQETVPAPPIYKIATEADENGKISDGKLVGAGADFALTVTPNDQYTLKGLTVNGQVVTVENNAYSLTGIGSDVLAKAEFMKLGGDDEAKPADDSKSTTSPKTGDETNIAIVSLIMLLAFAGMIVAMKRKSHQK